MLLMGIGTTSLVTDKIREVSEEWVKEAKTKAQNIAFKSLDNILTDGFHMIDKYAMPVLIIFILLFFLYFLATK